MPTDNNSVRVALRIRPQSARERAEHTNVCTAVEPGLPQITIGDKKSFTYDFVFDQHTSQQPIYDACIRELVEGAFDGYNATVLAYGQTGSGKTYTMGTSFDPSNDHHTGIIPRAAAHIFERIDALRAEARQRNEIEPQFEVSVQFIELYNEEIIDLLAEDRTNHHTIKIHEDPSKGGEIVLRGVTCATVAGADAILGALQGGALNRTTAATNMNQQSSRSHAIFTVQIKQQRMVAVNSEDAHNLSINGAAAPLSEVEMLTAKFHFVDLAGSERLKRTGATGDRAKEGISINSGLLALGNVISALGGGAGRVQHVPYRDSKLTRLLQDSLGGNSRTLMIACASPCDSDFVETLNTLNYANRAKNIRNKVVANQDKSSKLIGELRGRIAALEAELNEYRQGKKLVDENGQEVTNDQYLENVSLQHEANRLRIRVAALDETCSVLKQRCARLIEERELKRLGLVSGASADDKENNEHATTTGAGTESSITTAIRSYLEQIQELQAKLDEERLTSEELRKQNNRIRAHAQQTASGSYPASPYVGAVDSSVAVIRAAKREIRRRKRAMVAGQSSQPARGDESTPAAEDGGGSASSISPDLPPPVDDDVDDSSIDEEEDDLDDEEEEEIDVNVERDRLCSDIVTLQDDINVQEALVRELERKERCIADMRRAYEKKLNDLSSRIASVEEERDKMLADLTSKANGNKQSLERIQTVKEDYERKLGSLRNEFRQLKQVEKENRRMLAEQARSTAEMNRIRNEIQAMKRNKVELMNKLKEENRRNRDADAANRKRVAAMEKTARQQQYEIQRLKRDANVKAEAIKRKTEECQRLREKQRLVTSGSAFRPRRTAHASYGTQPPSSSQQPTATLLEEEESVITPRDLTYVKSPAASAATPRRRRSGALSSAVRHDSKFLGVGYSPVRAKRQWVALDKAVARLITQRQNIGNMEDELERRMAERHEAQSELERMRSSATDCRLSAEQRRALEEQCQSITANVEYISSEIVRLQNEIVDFDNDNNGGVAKDGEAADISSVDGGGEAAAIVEECISVGEAKYLLHHLVGTMINQGLAVAKAEYAKKELTARIQQMERDSQLIGQLMIAGSDERLHRNENDTADPAAAAVVMRHHRHSPSETGVDAAATSRPAYQTDKARRRTATTEELLYAISHCNASDGGGRVDGLKPIPEIAPYTAADTTMTISTTRLPEIPPRSTASSITPPPATTVGQVADSEAMKRSVHSNADDDVSAASSAPSGSAPVTERSRHSKTRIVACADVPRISGEDGPFLRRVATARHNRVVCLHSSANQMISGGKDRTAAVWDLASCTRVATLTKHPNNVAFVRLLAEHTHCAITGSMCIAKVWDLRSNNCVRTLYSSGLWVDGEEDESNELKDLTMYTCAMDREERFLFSTYGSSIRVWSLGDYRPITTLSSTAPGTDGKRLLNAQSPVVGFDSQTKCWVFRNDITTLTVCDQPHAPSSIMRLACGSRAGALGVHDFSPFTLTGHARDTLHPSHHDLVSATAAHGDKLFTASRAGDIMCFNLQDFKRNHVEPIAHSRAVSSVCVFYDEVRGLAPHLISACRGGTLKVWDVHSSPRMRHIETINQAHSKGIRDVCCNSELVFSAADDDLVAIWRHDDIASSSI